MHRDLRKGDQVPGRAGGGAVLLTPPPPASPEQQLKKTVDELQAKLALAKGEYKTQFISSWITPRTP